ncbi:MAG: tetratricopeptide repeat protein [Bacteroidia bacterium]|nr:tetratricopeptide repeat protein [Bacteroidia bacterium]
MSKLKNKQAGKKVAVPMKANESTSALPSFSLFPFSDFRKQAIIIAAIGLIFYFNSFFNDYALDDGIVIIKNEYVQQGLKGISKILSKDAYDSFYRSMNAQDQLSGGRYRPLSIVTFAIEQEFLGTTPDGKQKAKCWDRNNNNKTDPEEDINHDGLWNDYDCGAYGMHLRHVVNALLYILSAVVLLYFLRYIVFPHSPDMAFIATLLFTIHPIHTEVVANVKSRDEIMSILFICLTFIYAFRYKEDSKTSTLLKALVCFFLALLSKEYAVMLIVLLPLAFYLFKNYSVGKSVKTFLPYTFIILIYLMIRFSIVVIKADVPDNEVLNNPYLFATKSQKIATEISTTFNYLKLLLFPHPLSADYSYNSIPYKNFSHPLVWLSILVHVGMIYAGIKLFKKRHVLTFAIAFYLANLFLVCNIVLNIGATMGERLIYHSSVGFVIALSFLLVKGIEKISTAPSTQRITLATLLVIITLASGFKTIERNADWKNDITLFTKDVETVPNSALANGNAGARYIDMADMPANKSREQELLNKAITYLDKAIAIHPRYVTSYINRGLVYFKLDDLEKTKANWDMVELYYPHYPDIPRYHDLLAVGYLNKGLNFGKEHKYAEAIEVMEKASQINSNNPDIWYNLGGAYYTVKNYSKALDAWARAIQLNPNHQQALQGYTMLKQMMGTHR